MPPSAFAQEALDLVAAVGKSGGLVYFSGNRDDGTSSRVGDSVPEVAALLKARSAAAMKVRAS